MSILKKDYLLHKVRLRLISGRIRREKARVIKRNAERELEYGLLQGKIRSERIIVSLTSFPKRFSTIHICLKSLLLQDEKPDRIIVWFGEDVREDMLTPEMRELEEYGIEYRFVPGDLKPHKKYFYAMQEFPDAAIMTVDDDVVYPSDTISSLMKVHRANPGAVCARRLHVMKKDKEGNLLPYTKWKHDCRSGRKPSMQLFATGVGGVLYPSCSIHPEAFDAGRIAELCLGADDVWLKCMEMRQGTPVVRVPCLLTEPPVIPEAQQSALNQTNVNAGGNDRYIENMFSLYPELMELLD